MNPPLSLAALYALSPVERIQAGDAVLALRRYGAGPPLLLVHGWPLHGFTWRKLLPGLSRRFTCFVVDLAGAGDSEWTGRTDFDFHAHARRLKHMVDQLGLDRYSVLAHDTGGTVARCLGLIDGSRMDKLAIINTEMPGHRPPWIRLYQRLLCLPGAALIFRLIGIPWDVVDALGQRHAELHMPVLLIWGEDDPTFPIALARDMAKQSQRPWPRRHSGNQTAAARREAGSGNARGPGVPRGLIPAEGWRASVERAGRAVGRAPAVAPEVAWLAGQASAGALMPPPHA